MTHSLLVTVANMFGGKLKHEGADHFNDSLKAPEGAPAELGGDDYPWAESPTQLEGERDGR